MGIVTMLSLSIKTFCQRYRKSLHNLKNHLPVIILMGDHGPPANLGSPELRMQNLDAYLVDSNAKSKLYNSITPVNSFRIILDEYFGSDYPLLDDVSYYAYQLRQLKNSPTIIENTCK